ncbi:male accessory gland serine protease inhibitor-like [Scaptodrosophila lebanonensis]|uniref:Male accessory gland serine protease inhibitor-like n=1 Tax=Drosophila lebanonensis TaxID=7225 RepID=A0A6J2T8P6_DROLE|nr:male accessory gland serine protease inhibitor-like [Scaptodrosophila lebanonensis]
MKFLFALLLLTICVAHIKAQPPVLCRGRPFFQVCTGGRDEGNANGRLCGLTSQDPMWYYNSRQRTCIRMRYRGCGGNNNRYCTNADCLQRCRR